MNNEITIREIWIDNVKVFACILVVLGHFFQSMIKSAILPSNNLYQWFNQTIYYFHVPLFFICSGYLYQKNCKVYSFTSWKNNIMKKATALGVPYFVFSIITWVMKSVFSAAVNEKVGGVFHILFNEPLSPYWYLYCLFFIFVITPTFIDRKQAYIGLVIAFIFKILIIFGMKFNTYALSSVLSNEIWFVLGMCLHVFDVTKLFGKLSKLTVFVLDCLFLAFSVLVYVSDVNSGVVSFVMGLLGCASTIVTIGSVYKDNLQNVSLGVMAKYTMPIFLMHTIFAATLRSVLLKLGVESLVIHVVFGILVSFIGPIIAANFMGYFKFLDFLMYPNKYVKEGK